MLHIRRKEFSLKYKRKRRAPPVDNICFQKYKQALPSGLVVCHMDSQKDPTKFKLKREKGFAQKCCLMSWKGEAFISVILIGVSSIFAFKGL